MIQHHFMPQKSINFTARSRHNSIHRLDEYLMFEFVVEIVFRWVLLVVVAMGATQIVMVD